MHTIIQIMIKVGPKPLVTVAVIYNLFFSSEASRYLLDLRGSPSFTDLNYSSVCYYHSFGNSHPILKMATRNKKNGDNYAIFEYLIPHCSCVHSMLHALSYYMRSRFCVRFCPSNYFLNIHKVPKAVIPDYYYIILIRRTPKQFDRKLKAVILMGLS